MRRDADPTDRPWSPAAGEEATDGRTRSPGEEAFRFSSAPLLVCDTAGCVVDVNAALELLVGRRAAALRGASLSSFVAGLPLDLAEIARAEEAVPVAIRTEEGSARPCALQLRAVPPAGEASAARYVGTVIPDSAGSGALLEAAIDRLEHQGQIQHALSNLTHRLTLSLKEEEILGLFAQTIRDLLPQMSFCIRLTEPETHALRSLYAEGKLRPDARESVALTRKALERAGVAERCICAAGVRVVETLTPIFEGTGAGLAIPLAAAEELHGALNVEPPEGKTIGEAEEAVLQILASALAVAIYNLRLFEKAGYLKSFLENLIDHANALIVVIDRDRRVVRFNKALETLTGYAKDEVVGQSFVDWLPEEMRGRFLPVIINTLLGEATSNLETQLRRRDGTPIPVQFNTARILGSGGEVEGIIAVGQDLTPIKEMEHRVIHAEKLATLGEIAAGIVHELNNPLTSITVYAEYLLKKIEAAGNEEDAEKLRRVLEGASRIRKFSKDLVVYARPSAGQVSLIPVHEVLDRALSFCEHVLSRVSARTTRNFEPDLPPIFGVRDQLEQVLINIITNAAHAMEGRDPAELIVTTRRMEGREEIEVSIIDTGAGISEEDLPRIFDPFFTTKTEGKGTGLGLSIAQEIVKNHRGMISVRSRCGIGTTLSLRFPMAPRPGRGKEA